MFGRSSSVRLLTVSGIRVGVDVSWFVVLFLFIYLLAPRFRIALHSTDAVAYATTVVTVLALFASILVHEFGHALAARWRGVGVTAIDLNLFGGLTAMDREPSTPSDDFIIAVAGPLATVAVILVCIGLALALAGGHRVDDAIGLNAVNGLGPVLLGLSWMIPLNIALLAFNLLPALPLDGGRIARSAAWKLTGDHGRATVVAARLGQLLALALVGAGAYLLAGSRNWSGIYALLLAWILFSSARGEISRARMDERLDGVRVGDVMDTDPVTVARDLPVGTALEEFFWRYRQSWFAVVDDARRFVGILREEDVRASADAGESWVAVGSLTGGGAIRWHVDVDSPLTALLGSEALRTLGAAIVVDGDGVLVGIVSVEQVRRALTALPA